MTTSCDQGRTVQIRSLAIACGAVTRVALGS